MAAGSAVSVAILRDGREARPPQDEVDVCVSHCNMSRRSELLAPEYRFSPAQYQIAIEEFEHGLFLRDRLIAGDDGGDDHIATVIEGERQHRFRRWDADR